MPDPLLCGDVGGRTRKGEPCKRHAVDGEPCAIHSEEGANVGRPKIEFSDEQVEQIEKLAAVLSQEQIADFFGIHDETLRARIKEDEDIHRAYTRGRAKAVAGIAGGVIRAAQEGDMRAAQFYLQTQAGWSKKTQLEHTGEDGGEIVVNLVPDEDGDGA